MEEAGHHQEFLRQTLGAAGEEIRSRRNRDLDVNFKADASLITDADLASERVILEALRQEFPEDKVYSEEAGLSSQDRRPGSFIWIVDPLDGTTNFANGFPFYCISVGRGRFTSDGTIQVEEGAIFDPVRERLYWAARGAGAWRDGEPLRVAGERPFAQCFLVTGFYYMSGEELDQQVQRFGRVAQKCQSIRRDGSAALDLALVAEGTYDGFWELGLQPWDLAAGSLLVEEAGGSIRNYQEPEGKPFDVEGPGVIAGVPSAVREIAETL